MSGLMVMDEFEGLLSGVLRERVGVDAPAGLSQRLMARLTPVMASKADSAGMFGFAERVAVRRSMGSTWFAVGAHAVVLMALFGVAARHLQMTMARKPVAVTELVTPPAMPKHDVMGGGGGQHDLAPAAKGQLPKFAKEQLLAPKAPPTIAPKLAVEPTLMIQPDLKMANNMMPNMGAPSSSLAGISMGNGTGTGIGSGSGAGYGPGSGGGAGGGVLHVGGGVSEPMVIRQVDPEFSEEARKAKFSGNVEVYLWVDELGNPSHVHVVRGVGMGLDEKAVEAVRQYKFKPAMRNGKPVKVDLYIDVTFQIF